MARYPSVGRVVTYPGLENLMESDELQEMGFGKGARKVVVGKLNLLISIPGKHTRTCEICWQAKLVQDTFFVFYDVVWVCSPTYVFVGDPAIQK